MLFHYDKREIFPRGLSTIEIATEKDLVWAAWTQTDRIVKWFSPAAYIEPRLGGAFELYFDPANRDSMSTSGCKITKFEPLEQLAFTWRGPDDFAEIMNVPDSLTTVLVTLKERNGSTTVTIEHSGWGEGSEWEKALSWHQMAWGHVLSSLQSALQSGDGDLCCKPEEQASKS